MRNKLQFNIENLSDFKQSAIAWAREFDYFTFLDSNSTFNNNLLNQSTTNFDLLIGAGLLELAPDIAYPCKNLANILPDWHFGHICYDYKEETCNIASTHEQKDGFGKYLFYRPQWVIEVKNNNACLHYPLSTSTEEAQNIISNIFTKKNKTEVPNPATQFYCTTPKSKYTEITNEILKLISRGNIYEMNYCVNFTTNNTKIDPYNAFLRINEKMQAPFAAFYKNNASYLLSASPERFIKKKGPHIISQPIKGTAKRLAQADDDNNAARSLANNSKEIAENIMITDLVRNDLTKVAAINSVNVPELCKLYTFSHVHQLISTVSAKIDPHVNFEQIMQALFPMGSMTGAPKINAIKYAEKYENFRRGLYSGCVGYIDPEGNFDFNVVIRSVLYNAKTGYISCPAGSAITIGCIPENEFNECWVKANPIIEALNSD